MSILKLKNHIDIKMPKRTNMFLRILIMNFVQENYMLLKEKVEAVKLHSYLL